MVIVIITFRLCDPSHSLATLLRSASLPSRPGRFSKSAPARGQTCPSGRARASGCMEAGPPRTHLPLVPRRTLSLAPPPPSFLSSRHGVEARRLAPAGRAPSRRGSVDRSRQSERTGGMHARAPAHARSCRQAGRVQGAGSVRQSSTSRHSIVRSGVAVLTSQRMLTGLLFLDSQSAKTDVKPLAYHPHKLDADFVEIDIECCGICGQLRENTGVRTRSHLSSAHVVASGSSLSSSRLGHPHDRFWLGSHSLPGDRRSRDRRKGLCCGVCREGPQNR
jgi:hypothetical protein